MKTNLKLAYALLLIGFFGLSACDDEVQEPVIQFEFNPVNTASSIPAGRIAANTLSFTTGVIRLEEIEFEAEVDGTDSIEADIDMLVEIDFATGATNPDLSALVFPIGTYNRTEVELELLYQGSSGTPGIEIEGTFEDSQGVQHPIKFVYNEDQTFETEREGQVTFSEGANIIAQVTFDPVLWFAGVTSADLEAATKTDGVILVSKSSNPEIYDIVADGLDLASEFEVRFE